MQEVIQKHILECKGRVKNIENFMKSNKRADIEGCGENILILETAISALEEIQQYQALGTVEDLKALRSMEIEEWKKLKQYGELGTVEELREAMEKQVPKKPIIYTDTNRADCPACGATVRGIDKPFGKWCPKCGIKLDWSEQNETD